MTVTTSSYLVFLAHAHLRLESKEILQDQAALEKATKTNPTAQPHWDGEEGIVAIENSTARITNAGNIANTNFDGGGHRNTNLADDYDQHHLYQSLYSNFEFHATLRKTVGYDMTYTQKDLCSLMGEVNASAGKCLTIRNEDPTKGFGAQVIQQISGFAFCRACGCRFGFTQFKGFFGTDSLVTEANENIGYVLRTLGGIIPDIEMEQCFSTQDIHHHLNQNPNYFYTRDLAKRLRGAWPMIRPNFYDPTKYNVAVHVRRGDVKPTDPGKYDNDADTQKCLDTLQAAKLQGAQPNASKDLAIHIFTWNDKVKLVRNESFITQHVDGPESTLQTWNAFVHADALVIGTSTFSISAAVFREDHTFRLRSASNLIQHELPDAWRPCTQVSL